MDICFLITTYNRQESCQRLVDSLYGHGIIVVAHDGNKYEIDGALNINPNIHLGKRGYWKLINMLFRNRGHFKYYFMLPDDFLPTENMVDDAIEIWNSIEDPRKICLNLLTDRVGCSCWTNFHPSEQETTYHTQWVDMCFLCEERFFAELGTIPRIHSRNTGSSGVGAYISRHLHKKKFNMYQVKESLVTIQPEHYITQMQVYDNRPYRKHRR